MNKMIPCKVEIKKGSIGFILEYSSLDIIGVDKDDIREAMYSCLWSDGCDKVVASLKNLLEDMKVEYTKRCGSANWKYWEWYAVPKEDGISFEFAYAYVVTEEEIKEELRELFADNGYTEEYEDDDDYDEDCEDDCYPFDNVADDSYISEHGNLVTVNPTVVQGELDHENLIYSAISENLESLARLAGRFMSFAVTGSCLYKLQNGKYALEISQHLDDDFRRRLTNSTVLEYPDIEFFGKTLSKIGHAYAEEHNTFVLRNRAVEELVDQFL